MIASLFWGQAVNEQAAERPATPHVTLWFNPFTLSG